MATSPVMREIRKRAVSQQYPRRAERQVESGLTAADNHVQRGGIRASLFFGFNAAESASKETIPCLVSLSLRARSRLRPRGWRCRLPHRQMITMAAATTVAAA